MNSRMSEDIFLFGTALLIFCGQSLEVFDLNEIHVILFLYWKNLFELLIFFPWFDAVTCMFLTLIHRERTINTVQEYIFYFSYWAILFWLYYMYDFCFFAFLFCFLIKSLKKNRNRCITTVNLWVLCLNSKWGI